METATTDAISEPQRIPRRDPDGNGDINRHSTGSRSEALIQHGVNQAIFNRLSAAHEVIAIRIHCDFFDRLTGMFGQNTIEPVADQQDLTRMNVKIAGLPLKST